VMAVLPFDLAVPAFDDPELAHYRPEIIRRMGFEKAAPLIDAMASDQQADLFRELTEKERQRFLHFLDGDSRRALEMLLRYPPDTAGGLMTTEFVSMPTTWTVQQALDYIAKVGRAKETVYAIYLLDPAKNTLEQVVSLRDLMVARDRTQPVGALGEQRAPITVEPTCDRIEAARQIAKYNLLAVPVVDETRHMLGIVTVDDVIDAIVREQTDDVHRFGGVEVLEHPYLQVGFWAMIRKRAGWLTALFLGEMLTATAMGYFEAEIVRAVVLALFVPLIISSGGNSGSQATSLIIRSLALRELKLRDWWRVALRELPSGLTLGMILGIVGMTRILLWQEFGWYNYGPHWHLIALTVAGALIGVVTFGSIAGSMLPFIVQRLGFDPASACAPLVATLVDVTGLVIYFTVASLILRGTLL
ncbi:MAG TPA: magnesium transporter, partial [Gemmatimonadaceae bacterium]